MLTDVQMTEISRHMSNFFHISELNSPVFGEPFFDDGYIYYFDGAVLTFMTERVNLKTDAKSVSRSLSEAVRVHRPEGVILWGEVPEKLDVRLEGYDVVCQKMNDLFKTEMRVFGGFSLGTKARRAVNRAEKQEITLKFVEPEFYLAEHMRLLAETHENRIDSSNGLAYYLLYPMAEKIRLGELRTKEGVLVGVMIVYDNSPRYACLLEIGYKSDIPRAGTMTFSAFLNEFLGKVEIISLGGSATEGIFRNKTELFKNCDKWSQYPHYIWQEYRRKGATSQSNIWWIERMKKRR